MEKEYKKEYVYIYIESLCSTPETNNIVNQLCFNSYVCVCVCVCVRVRVCVCVYRESEIIFERYTRNS